MREKNPEQLSIFDILPDMEKPEEFYMPDSFKGFKKGVDHKGQAYEKARYIGNEEIPNNVYTIYVRRSVSSCGERYIVSVPAIDFDFGYNSLDKLLADWEIEVKNVSE
jgi:hypothetical protein